MWQFFCLFLCAANFYIWCILSPLKAKRLPWRPPRHPVPQARDSGYARKATPVGARNMEVARRHNFQIEFVSVRDGP